MNHLAPLLLPWFAGNKRDLPWRRDREPYHVWLSEIMLQQTRVEAVRGYYSRFLQALPDIASLAEAPEDLLLKLWEGLGYYSRARNLQKAARIIRELHGGSFPRDYAAIRALPGIGDYTAGAISSICFDAPRAAVDGNVLRVLSRYRADHGDISLPQTKKAAARALEAVYPPEQCGDFTQALMELGATVCLPNGAPLCESCPLKARCRAKALGCQRELPVKAPKKPRKSRARTVLILLLGEKIALCRRPETGLLAGLWQLPDTEGSLSAREALELAERWGLHPTQLLQMQEKRHVFTHVTWEMRGYYIRCSAEGELSWFDRSLLQTQIGLPTAYRQFLDTFIV
ncbi:MAG: A/G-specific adenine glycosylase [Oscillospiraceae bacterium]|nr:A/G-specific adenine glycosylase [Oscillospiraceae bacterium]